LLALALCQAYGQLAALEADNARLQEEDDLPEGKLYPRVKGIEDDDTLTATGARARRECISLDLSTLVLARPEWGHADVCVAVCARVVVVCCR
jgi:hypothetical protein